MIEEKLYDVLRCPVVSEKSTNASQFNKYIFKVVPQVTKGQVKQAVEKIFNVKVTRINSINMPGKVKIFKGKKGKQSDYKKVIVTLAKGNVIDLSMGIK